MTESFVQKARANMGFSLAVLVTFVLLIGALMIGVTWTDSIVSVTMICAGYAVGGCIGTAISPASAIEEKRFASYGRAVVAFASGFVASKLESAAGALMHSPGLTNPSALTIFRALAFTTTVLVVARTTFTCRNYD